ncbi:MAG: DUF4349 domain-containing protein [Peptococcaceae bacterium]|nr:DUF4349 domain-containing protein [Peptococcaceae bacterium]
MSCCKEEIKELLSSYVDDACSELEKQAVEQHIAGCADCRQALAELRLIVAALREMPDIPLPAGFQESFQARFAAELAADHLADQPEEAAASVIPLGTVRKKHWFQSRRFVGIAATVLLCFSVSVIGGHINHGYDHFVRNGLYQETVNGEQAYQESAAMQKNTAVVNDDQYNGGIFPDLSVSKAVREEEGFSASSRDGSAVEHYILAEPYEMKSEGIPSEADGLPVSELDNETGIAPVSIAAGSEGTDNMPASADGGVSSRKLQSTQNSQLEKAATQQMTVAQNASSREVYNGYMALVTEDVDGVKEKVVSVAAQYDGFVDEEVVLSGDGGDSNRHIRLTICVKSEHLGTAMTEIAGFGKVTAQSVNRVDLSEAYYDAQGRLTRQRALEQSLLRLIAEAKDVETIHALEQELEKVTTEIETIIANLEKISQQRKYSALVINISTDPLAGAGSVTLGDRFQLGFQAFVGFCKSFPDNLLVGFGFMFEIFAVVLILSILFYLVMHKLLRKPAAVASSKNEPKE